jgi:GntR family transcriptional regulator, transcriptional repressor for pyruvate dehydrogenase complex
MSKVGAMRITDEAINRIRQMIVSGELRPGDRLPREADLAEHLGLSRNSLREAVKALALIRVLDVRQGDGTYVTSLDPALLLESMGFVVELHQDSSVLDMFDVRRILEPAAVARAARRMSEAEIAEAAALLDSLPDKPSVEELVANDMEFHRLLAAGSGNQVLCSLVDGLKQPTYRARVWRGFTEEGAVARTLAEHRAILDAIAARDPDVASSWMTVHISGVEHWLRQSSEANQESDRPDEDAHREVHSTKSAAAAARRKRRTT